MAPIVSVNLSEQAYSVYREWKAGRRGSKLVSFAIVQYQLRSEQIAMLQIGDKKVNEDGYPLIWTEDGWSVDIGGVE